MGISFTLLSLVETLITAVIIGCSTMAIIIYFLSVKYGRITDVIGKKYVSSVFGTIRIFHVLLGILVAIFLIVYGFFDGINEAKIVYGVKAVLLVLNAVIAYALTEKLLDRDIFTPFIVAGWYTFGIYHAYSLIIFTENIIFPLILYFVVLLLVQILFISIRKFVKKRDIII